MIIESPLNLVFRDLFYRLRAFAGSHDVFLKLEGFNITGSIKIKTAIGTRRGPGTARHCQAERNRHRQIVIRQSWNSAQPGMRRQRLRIHLRDGSKHQSRQCQRDGALRGKGHRR